MTSPLRVGYVPYTESFQAPGDYRRFVAWARARKVSFELARPERPYDVVVLSERADVTSWVRYSKGKVVYDFIDSYLSIPRTDVKQWLRGTAKYLFGQSREWRLDYWAALRDMCKRADAVVCTTAEQQADIKRYCANVHVILDVHSAVVSKTKETYRVGAPLKLVWEGLPGNVVQLRMLTGVLKQLHRRLPLELYVVTDLTGPRFLGRFGRVDSRRLAASRDFPVVVRPWSRESLSDAVCECDIAIIPLDLNDRLVSGKPENKLVLLWRMGMPVVVSATPAYRRAMEASGVGMFCRDEREWFNTLVSLSGDESARKRAGSLGKEYAEANFGTEQILQKWDFLFQSCGFDVGAT